MVQSLGVVGVIADMIEPVDAIPTKMKPIWTVGIRLAFDWRYYYARKKTTK